MDVERTQIWRGPVQVGPRKVMVTLFSDGSATCACLAGNLFGARNCAHITKARGLPSVQKLTDQVKLGAPPATRSEAGRPENPYAWEGKVLGWWITCSNDGIVTCACGGTGSKYQVELPAKDYTVRCEHIRGLLAAGIDKVQTAIDRRRLAFEAQARVEAQALIEKETQARLLEKVRWEAAEYQRLEEVKTRSRQFGADFAGPTTQDASLYIYGDPPIQGEPLVTREEVARDPADVPISERFGVVENQRLKVRAILMREIMDAARGSRYAECTPDDIDLTRAIRKLGGYESLCRSSEREIARAVGLTRWHSLLKTEAVAFEDLPLKLGGMVEIAREQLTSILERAGGIPVTEAMLDRAEALLGRMIQTYSEKTLETAVGQLDAVAIFEEPAPPPSPYDGVALRPGALVRTPGRRPSALGLA